MLCDRAPLSNVAGPNDDPVFHRRFAFERGQVLPIRKSKLAWINVAPDPAAQPNAPALCGIEGKDFAAEGQRVGRHHFAPAHVGMCDQHPVTQANPAFQSVVWSVYVLHYPRLEC